MPFLSPLRYPGGKRKLSGFMKLVYVANRLVGGEYAEPYGGGAAVGLALLLGGYVRRIHLNDLDRAVYAFWHALLNETETLCRLIRDTPVNVDQWWLQRQVQDDGNASLLALGFSTFYLNRTNRSGIIRGGVIGGKNQAGKWKLDVRFNKSDLIARVQNIARHRARIRLHNLDALEFVQCVVPDLPGDTLCYLDPPYLVKGRQRLYASYYEPGDHREIAAAVRAMDRPWIVTYDDATEIRALYSGARHLTYGLHYTAGRKQRGSEIMFFSADLVVPDVKDPVRLEARRDGTPCFFVPGLDHSCAGR